MTKLFITEFVTRCFVAFCRQHPFLLGDLDRNIARNLLSRAYSSTVSPYLTSSGSSRNGPRAHEDPVVQSHITSAAV